MTDQPISEPIACPESLAGQAPAETSATSASLSNQCPSVIAPGSDVRPFGAELEPVLRSACAGRLSGVTWFRTDWQRGGAATGTATFMDDDGREQPVVVKLPVQPRERLWLERLQAAEHVVPKLHAHGQTLNGYDIAWVVMQRVPHGPLGTAWGGAAFDLTIAAAARFYAATSQFPVSHEPSKKDWHKILELARQHVRDHNVAQGPRWNKALKKAQHKLRDWVAIWQDRPIDQWCHGDLHLGNAMSLAAAPQGPALLLDLAEVHAGNWVEDAVYFEHLYWSRREQLDGRKICKALAHERRSRGLEAGHDWARLADTRRALLAMSTPAMLMTAVDPLHVQAALEMLEIQVG